jgi:hypothetical protein
MRGWLTVGAACAVLLPLLLAPSTGAQTGAVEKFALDPSKTVVNRSSLLLGPDTWTIPDQGGTIVWNARDWSGTYTFQPPQELVAEGTPMTMTVSATEKLGGAGNTISLGMGVSGPVVGSSPQTVGAVARAGGTDTQTRTVTLIGRDSGNVLYVVVGIQDGPTYTFTYNKVTTPPPAAPPPATPPPTTAVTNATVTPNQAFTLPSARRCASRRNFIIRLKRPGRVRYLAARVTVNGKRTAVFIKRERYLTVRGRILLERRLAARVDLRGLSKGTFRVGITAVTTSLRTLRGTRSYRTCEPRRR